MRTSILATAALGALAVLPSAADAAAPACRAADLSARVGDVQPGAGQRTATLSLRNTSGHACRLRGYVGLRLETASGAGLPTSTARTGGPARTVTLRPGGRAVATLQWTVIATGDEPADGPCEGTPSDLLVTPPGQRTATAAPWRNGPVCDRGRFTVTPLRAAR
ncbi:MAG: DUF4232 domain-containing protein [Solirubrobacteraceae bacterium]|nr:DUF4232 domain-containing protein [Solirubrobacteraceae bacterium]